MMPLWLTQVKKPDVRLDRREEEKALLQAGQLNANWWEVTEDEDHFILKRRTKNLAVMK